MVERSVPGIVRIPLLPGVLVRIRYQCEDRLLNFYRNGGEKTALQLWVEGKLERLGGCDTLLIEILICPALLEPLVGNFLGHSKRRLGNKYIFHFEAFTETQYDK